MWAEMYMRGNSKIIKLKELVNIFIQTGIYMKVSGWMINSMDKVRKHGQMDQNT